MSDLGFQPKPPDPLFCVGLSGAATFFVDYLSPTVPGDRSWLFRVHQTPEPNMSDYWFELDLEPFDGKLRSATMAANRARYRKHGIPEAALRYARRITGSPIVSSTNKSDQDEWQEPEVTKVWKRIPEATYDWATDRYTLP